MRLQRFAVMAIVGFAVGASAAVPGAPDWRTSKARAIAYMDAYEAQSNEFPAHLAEARRLAASIEDSEKSMNAQAKAMLVLHEPDAQRRAERGAAADALLDLRLLHLYGNLIPRILNDFDSASYRAPGSPGRFPVRPVEITHERFLERQSALIEQLGFIEVLDEPAK